MPTTTERLRPFNIHYDIVTITAVANDVHSLELALALGASVKKFTSRYV